MENHVLVFTLALGLLALVCGALIAMFVSRRAPDGFEDDNGCHLSARRPSTQRQSRSIGLS